MNAHMADLRGTGAATAAAAVGSADGGDALQAALAEVAQLRRENARLRAQQASTLVGPLMHKQLGSVAPSDGRADGLKRRSFEMTGTRRDMDSWVKMAQNRAHMRGAGFEDADFTKPIVTVQHPPSPPPPPHAAARAWPAAAQFCSRARLGSVRGLPGSPVVGRLSIHVFL